MAAHYFAPGVQFEWNATLYEVIRAFPHEGKVSVEDLRASACLMLDLSTLIQAFFAYQLTFRPAARDHKSSATPTEPPTQDLSDFTPKQAAVARFRYDVIRPLLPLRPKERTTAVIQKRIEEVHQTWDALEDRFWLRTISGRSVRRWISCCLRRGGDVRALVPDVSHCGGPGRSRLPLETDAIIRQVVEELYKTRETVTVKDIRYEVAARIEAENRLRPAADHLICPSVKAISRRIEALDLREWLEAKRGKRTARQELRQHYRQPRPELPYDTIEMDSTPLDLIVVDDEDALPLGRPTVTYGLDLATGYPAGYYIGFEPPSYGAVMECLYHIIWLKGEVKEKYGTANPWPLCGVPARIVLDNGPEFNNRHLQDTCLSLGIEVLYAPVRTPEFKARIERYFGALNTGLVHTLPGTTFSTPQARGDYGSATQACLRLSDLIKAMHLFVVDVFAQEYHRGLDGIPARRWEAAQQRGFLPRLPDNARTLQIQLGRVEYRTVQAYGIELEGLRYNAPALGLLRQRLTKGDRVKLKYHPGDLSRVYVFDPFAAGDIEPYLEVPASDPDGYTRHLSLWKHRVIRRLAATEGQKPDLAALGQAKQKIRALVQSAKGRKRQRGRKRIARFEGEAPSLADVQPSRPCTAPVLPAADLPPPVPSLPEPAGVEEPVASDEWGLTFDRPSRSSKFA